MNKVLNLCEILKGHEGETFYSPLFGDVKLYKVSTGKEEYCISVITNKGETKLFRNNGSYELCYDTGELMLFPSKEQRDWNKWLGNPKTWDKIKNHNNEIKQAVDYLNYVSTNPIIKSAQALLKIHELIAISYGGNITNEEWNNGEYKYTIETRSGGGISIYYNASYPHKIAFHTKWQAEEFLSYSENVQLIKDYYMI